MTWVYGGLYQLGLGWSRYAGILCKVLDNSCDLLGGLTFTRTVECRKVESPVTSRGRDKIGSKSPDFASSTLDLPTLNTSHTG